MSQIKSQLSTIGDVSLQDEQCIVCGALTTFCCSRCRRVYYCSQSCQRLDWRSHKLTCTEVSSTPPPKAPSIPSAGLPEPSIPLEAHVSLYERATETFKQSLMARFGSIVGAYEWFDANAGGAVEYQEFEKTLNAGGVTKTAVVKQLFSVLDRAGAGRISLSQFLAEAVKKLNPRSLDDIHFTTNIEKNSEETVEKTQVTRFRIPPPSEPSSLPPGRRALRAASILAFRNGRYDDAMVSALQALGITSSGSRWASTVPRHGDSTVELLLLCRIFAVTNQVPRGAPFAKLLEEIFPLNEGANSPYPAHVHMTLLSCIGDILDQYGQVDSATKFFQEYLSMTKSVFGEKSLVYGDALTIVSGFHLRNGELNMALAEARDAVTIRSENLRTPHARLADAYCNRGLVFKALRRFRDAIPDLKECAEQRVKLFGANSLPVADAFMLLGTSYTSSLNALTIDSPQDADIRAEAAKFLLACHAIRLKLLGPLHKETVLVADMIQRIGGHQDKERMNLDSVLLDPAEVVRPVSPVPSHVRKSSRAMDEELPRPESPPYVFEKPKVEPPIVRQPSEVRPVIEEPELVTEPPTILDASVSPVIQEAVTRVMEESEDEESDSHALDEKIEPVPEPRASIAKPSSIVGALTNTPPPSSKQSKGDKMNIPASPFKDALDRMGPTEFMDRLLQLDAESLLSDVNFNVQSAFPSKKLPAFWFPIAMKAVYAKRVTMDELSETSLGHDMEMAFGSIKKAEQDIRLVFSLLKGVSKNLVTTSGASSIFSSKLNVDNFSTFLFSKTQNLTLMEYFTELLVEKHPETYEAVCDGLSPLAKLPENATMGYMNKLEVVRKSLVFVDKELSKLTLALAGPTEEGDMIRQVVGSASEIKQTLIALDNRAKIISAGSAVVRDLFGIKKAISKDIDIAVKDLLTMHDLLLEYGEQDEEDDSQQDSQEEERSESQLFSPINK